MFKKWLNMKPDASWSELVAALKTIELNTAADSVQCTKASRQATGTAQAKRFEAGAEQASVEFGILLDEILEELMNNAETNLRILKRTSSALTIKDKSDVRMFSDSEVEDIYACNNIETLLVVKLRHCYRWDDHSMLDVLVSHLNAQKCQKLLHLFDTKVYSKMKLQQIQEHCSKESSKFSDGYHKMVAIVDGKIFSSITKEEYDELKQFTADHCGVESHVMSPFSKASPFNSIVIEWFIPVNAVSYMMETAKANALKFTNRSIVYLKISSTVIFDNRKNAAECDQLLGVAGKGDVATVQRLINTRYIDVNTTEDVVKKTALHHASWSGHFQVVQTLIRLGADVHALDWRNATALQFAIERKHVHLVEILIRSGANVNALDARRMTLLHHAAKKGLVQVIEMLIRSGANVKSLDKDNETALHHAARNGCIQIVTLLIHYGADVNALDVKNRTPLHLALKRVRRDVVWFIAKELGFDNTHLDQETHREIKKILSKRNKKFLLYHNHSHVPVVPSLQDMVVLHHPPLPNRVAPSVVLLVIVEQHLMI